MADRVVHHAVHRVLARAYDRRFIEHSYACLPGRGAHRALHTALARMQRFRWVVALDVAAFFYSIRRSDVQALMQRAFPEPPVGRLIGAILASGEGLIGRAEAAWLGWPNPPGDGCGLPIGNLTSQWWGNVILDGLDHHAQRTLRIPAYQRYMDDMLLFSDSRAQLEEARDALGAWLLGERGLRLKDPCAPVTSTRRPRVVLGYRLGRDGFVIADKARQRARQRLRAGTLDASGLTATAACWMFGA